MLMERERGEGRGERGEGRGERGKGKGERGREVDKEKKVLIGQEEKTEG